MSQSGPLPSEGSIRLHVAPSASVAAAHVEALLERLEQTTEPRERATILVEVARGLKDDLGDDGQAVDALLEAWRADPTFEPVLDELEPLVRAHGRWGELLELTRKLATDERDPRRAIVFAETMVRWLTRDVPDPELARQWLERVRQLDSTHSLVHLLQAAVSREHGDLKRELDELDLAVLSARRADDRARIHLIMASRFLDERTLSLASAKKHYEAAHKLFPRTMDPLLGLEDVALREGDKVALADVLRKQAEADVELGSRLTILLRLAALEEKEFRRPELAAQTLEHVVALDPSNEGALEGLERCYSASRAWSDLARILERGAASAADAETRSERLRRLGEVLESKLGDVRAAIATYERLSATVQDETVLSELARLAEKAGDIPLAVRAREDLAVASRDRSLAARHYVVAGQLLAPVDAARARQEFERAVAVDPANQAAWSALLWDARAENDAGRVVRYLEERAERTEAPRARAAAYVELAEALARAGDGAASRAAWEKAMEADPSNESAAGALVLALVAEGRHADAEASCDVAISAAERDKDYERLFALRKAQVEIGRALGKPDRALVAARAGYELKPGSAEAAEILASVAADMRADPQVLALRALLVGMADQPPDGLSVTARVQLADVLVLTGDADRAATLYDEALAEEPDNERALAGLAQHHTAQGNPVAALALKRQLARGIPDEAERFATFLEVAEAFTTKAQADELAAEVYEEARRLRPRDLPVLHKLLGLYQKLARWASVFDVLRSIAEADADPVRRTKTLYTMAQIAKEELADRGGALALFEQALDVDPSFLVAFERLVTMLTEERDWLGLERIYGKMIARTEGGDPVVRRALWKQLGLVQRDRLKRHEPAIQCFQAAVQLDPHDEEAQSMLRELLARHGQADSAVAITIDRVLREPLDPAPYPALFDLLVQQGARDRALAVASAMRFLGVQHAAAAHHRASFPQPPVEGIVMDLGGDGYRALLHEGLDPSVTEIFEVVAPAVVEIALSKLSLRQRIAYPGPTLKSSEWLAKAAVRAAQILGAPAPRLFAQRTPGPGLTHVATKPMGLMVYAPALGGIATDVTSFIIGKRVMEASPPLVARALCPSITELKALGASAARIATGQAEAGDAPLRERLKKDDVARIAAAVERAMQATAKLDVLRWSQLAGVSAARAGLLLAGDLEAARAAIALEPQAPGDLTPREKMKELVAWYLGDACATLRRRIGVAL